jgi:hypothetical protein
MRKNIFTVLTCWICFCIISCGSTPIPEIPAGTSRRMLRAGDSFTYDLSGAQTADNVRMDLYGTLKLSAYLDTDRLAAPSLRIENDISFYVDNSSTATEFSVIEWYDLETNVLLNTEIDGDVTSMNGSELMDYTVSATSTVEYNLEDGLTLERTIEVLEMVDWTGPRQIFTSAFECEVTEIRDSNEIINNMCFVPNLGVPCEKEMHFGTSDGSLDMLAKMNSYFLAE